MKVKFFAQVREFTQCEEIEIATSQMSSGELWDALELKFPGIARYKNSTRLARNFSYAAADSVFQEGDEVALIPPVSGG